MSEWYHLEYTEADRQALLDGAMNNLSEPWGGSTVMPGILAKLEAWEIAALTKSALDARVAGMIAGAKGQG